MTTELELLRRFEPVVRYTQGEIFFPCAVEGYLNRCSLWRKDARGKVTMLLDYGEVTPEDLAKLDRQAEGGALFLRFTDQPLPPLAYQQWLASEDHPVFESPGRLSRVGIAGRMAEALFDFSLLLRGRVPGGTTGRAALQYKDMRQEDPRLVYYGRVIRDSDYIILHYLFFYAMNDWRSTFHGVNDHEADWEQVFVYVTEEDGEYVPQWVAFAAHDFSGDDLRRRWDDPELTKVDDTHIVVYAAAGSHAAYIQPGEYLMHVEPAFLKPVRRLVTPIQELIAEVLDPDDEGKDSQPDAPLFSLAFVDYARGDGVAIGPGQAKSWSPELLSDELPWVGAYRGLWGLDTQDPFGGERAPAGPKFDRSGDVRHAWSDPLGWSGLDKVPAPARQAAETEAAIAAVAEEAGQTRARISEKRAALRAQGLTVEALSLKANLAKQRGHAAEQLVQTSKELQALTDTYAELRERERTLRDYLTHIRAGDRGDPQAHLRHRAIPEPPPPIMARYMDLWAAASGALLVTTLILIVAFRPLHWPLWLVSAVLIFGLIEAWMRDGATNYLVATTIVLAVIAAIALAIEYWHFVIPALLIGIFFYSFLVNLGELRARKAHKK